MRLRIGMMAVMVWLTLPGGCARSFQSRSGVTTSASVERAAVEAAQAGDWKGALQFWREALARNPNDPFLLNNLALAEDAAGNEALALAYAARACALRPDSAALAVNYGLILDHRGQPGPALAEYRRALEIDRAFEPALLAVATWVLRHGDAAEAERQFGSAIRQHPRSSELWTGWSLAAVRQGRWLEAAKRMDEAAALRSSDAVLVATSGALYYQARMTEAAATRLDRALRLDPDQADALLLRAELYWRAQDYAAAEELLQRAVVSERDLVERAGVLLRRGELALELDQPGLARAWLAAALRAQGQPQAWKGRAQLALGWLALKREAWDEAQRSFVAARELLGETAVVLAGLAHTVHGRALGLAVAPRLRAFAEAETLYRKALDLEERPAWRLALGKLYLRWAGDVALPYRRGKLYQAEVQLREALARNDSVETRVHLALLAEALGRTIEAATHYRKAIELEPRSAHLQVLAANFYRREAERTRSRDLARQARHGFARAATLDPKYLPAHIGWYLMAATQETAPTIVPLDPEMAGPTQETMPPELEDLLPFFQLPEEDIPRDPDVIPIHEKEDEFLYSVNATGAVAPQP